MPGLDDEIKAFEKLLPELLSSDAGKFALIFKGNLLGTFTSQEDALKFGLDKVGNKEFLIRQIVPITEPLYFFHGISSCH